MKLNMVFNFENNSVRIYKTSFYKILLLFFNNYIIIQTNRLQAPTLIIRVLCMFKYIKLLPHMLIL